MGAGQVALGAAGRFEFGDGFGVAAGQVVLAALEEQLAGRQRLGCLRLGRRVRGRGGVANPHGLGGFAPVDPPRRGGEQAGTGDESEYSSQGRFLLL